ncbi:predicted protein [Naegleria gruberi]|uniref:Predicted protein n=1 Tax=Naegleria gruberi TaxID=5762 RepID=D2VBJ9_NAEGR|nr:uncharacterized protein NAEGRDRAFT_48220 [Naegleria gruberi]EFC45920.1 predicted protein [Naegleria gruberi]|eukprot:XP_002678664.1 predicted protein [Naegleria gruberi strain NEG-M]
MTPIKNTTPTTGDESSPNIYENVSNSFNSERRNTNGSGVITNELGVKLLKLNRKILEPILKDLEIANLVFSSVNASTKKALKEFVFLKQKEQIERAQIKKMLEERNAQLLIDKKNRRRKVPNSIPLKQEQNSVKFEPPQIETPKPKQVEILPEPTPQPNRKSIPQKKATIAQNSTPAKKGTVSKTVNEKNKTPPVESNIPEKPKPVSNQKKKLEDILAMARKIRTREEEPATRTVVENEEKYVNIEPVQKQILNEETEPEEEPQNSIQQSEEEPKLSFVTIDERFQHFVSVLQSFNDVNERVEELSSKLSKKSGWHLIPPKHIHSKKTAATQPPKISMQNRYNSIITKCSKAKESFNDIEDFKNRFCFNEEEMKQLEKELLLNTKDKRKPEITSTSIIYSDIPNSYICRWLPKRVNKQTTQTIVPHRDLAKKFDKRRARFPCRLFNFKNKKELENIYLKRFEVQQLMLKNHLYQNIFKGDSNLLNYLPQLKEEGQEDVYYKLLRTLEGIIPCEALRNENRRNIINWKSFYHFLPSSNSCSNSLTEEDNSFIEDTEEPSDEE